MKVLVIQLAFLGDTILSLSLAEELRRLEPLADISYLVRPEALPIVKACNSVNYCFTFDKYGTESGMIGLEKKATELNMHNFDVVFTLHSSKRTSMLLKRLNVAQKIGYGDSAVLTSSVFEVQEPQTARAVRLLSILYPECNLRTLPRLTPDNSALPSSMQVMSGPIVALAIDSVWRTKQWGKEKFISLANELARENIQTILLGNTLLVGAEDPSKLLNINILDLTAKTSLESLIAVISKCDMLVSNDSASVHIALATGTKSVVIYGPTIPELGFAPPREYGLTVESEHLWCRPCTSHGGNECPIHTHECMGSIAVDEVIQSVLAELIETKI